MQPWGVPYVTKSLNELLHPAEVYFTRSSSEPQNLCISGVITLGIFFAIAAMSFMSLLYVDER